MPNTLAFAGLQAVFPGELREPPASQRAGRVARGSARRESRTARNAFHHALVQIESIFSEAANDVSVKTWRRLARGSWSLVTEFELEGRRYYLVNEDGFAPTRCNALTRRERTVFRFAEVGLANKLIACSLGVSASTVASLLHNARKKIRRTFRMELASRLKHELEKNEGNQDDSGRQLPTT